MRLTLHTDYSLRVLMFAGANGENRTTIHEIATKFHISENHLMKVVHGLTMSGLLESSRGRYGGLKLPPSTLEIPLGELIRQLESDLALVPCMEEDGQCPIKKICVLRKAVEEAMGAFFDSLNRYTFGDLLAPRSKLVKALDLVLEPGTGHLSI